MRKRELDEAEIVRLYTEEGLRAQAIADHLGVTAALVYERLEQAGVVRSRLARLPLEEAIRLYVDERWSANKIGAKFAVSDATVRNHLRAAGVKIRSSVAARQPPGRLPCPRSAPLRSYMLGLVWGDFHVRRHGNNGETISIMASTTHPEQLKVFNDTFAPFGPTHTWQDRYMRASVGVTFEFLFDKYGWEVPAWIRGPEAEASFAAGYIDAEGCFGVYEGRARFKIDSYDVSVLHWMHEWCHEIGIDSKLLRVQRRGDPRSVGPPFRADLWRVNVNAGPSILRLVATLEPYLRHGRRIADAAEARDSVINRLRSRGGNRTQPMHRDPGAHRSRQEHAR
jgi:predicted DNA-binding protein (UPF0251 family)